MPHIVKSSVIVEGTVKPFHEKELNKNIEALINDKKAYLEKKYKKEEENIYKNSDIPNNKKDEEIDGEINEEIDGEILKDNKEIKTEIKDKKARK